MINDGVLFDVAWAAARAAHVFLFDVLDANGVAKDSMVGGLAGRRAGM